MKETFDEAEIVFKSMADMKDVFVSGERKREYHDHRLEWMIKSGGLKIVREGIQKDNVTFSWPEGALGEERRALQK